MPLSCLLLCVPLQSLLARPLYLTEEPPQLRSLRHLTLLHTDLEEVPAGVSGTRDEALAFAAGLARRAAAGDDFGRLAARHSHSRDASTGAVLGTFAPGMLPPELDAFLFAAEVDEVSAPIVSARGVHLLQRVETYAGMRQIFVAGSGEASRQEIEALRERVLAREDFAELAREASQDPDSAARGGDYAIFERGPNDRLLKAATFALEVGALSEPLASPLGWHLVQRVPVDSLDPALAEQKWIRVRAILIAWAGAVGAGPEVRRDELAARTLAEHLHQRIASGEDMARVAAGSNDDPGGRERAGDLGWIHRGSPDLPQVVQRVFSKPESWLSEPLPTSAGFVILRRGTVTRVAVLIPALDEEQALPLVLAELPADRVAGVVVVDNGSRDRTPEVAREGGAFVVSEPRRGYGQACLAGLAALGVRTGRSADQAGSQVAPLGALAAEDVVVFLDADHSDHPADLPLLLAPLLDGSADFVVGSRVLGGATMDALLPQAWFGNRLACGLMRLLFGARYTDLGPFRAIRVAALEHLAMRDRDFGWTVEMQLKAKVAGLRSVEVPVRYRVRIGESKITGTVWGTLRAGTKILGWIFGWRLALWFTARRIPRYR